MLLIAGSLSQLSFSALMEVYAGSNLEKAREDYFPEPEAVGLRLAEADFYAYLSQVFFTGQGSVYAIWAEKERYVSALRLERWQDGLLLTGLETAPDCRGQGYAGLLIRAVLEKYPGQNIYSHVHKENKASLAVHERCGFQRILDYSRYLDGSVNSRACTLLRPGIGQNAK